MYGEDQWFLIEDANYDALLNICLEKKEEQDNQLAAEEHKETAQEEEEEEKVICSSWLQICCFSLLGLVLLPWSETIDWFLEPIFYLTCNMIILCIALQKADALLITNEAVMNSSPPAFQFVEAPVDFAHQSVGGILISITVSKRKTFFYWGQNHSLGAHCGWLRSEEETDPDEDEDSDEMIQLTPEPLCEELEELLREVYGQKKMKYN